MNVVEKSVAAGLAAAPAPVVQIEPVGRGRRTGRVSPAFMPFDTFCRLVAGLLPPLELRLAGEGEPLLHPRFFDMASHAASRGLEVTTLTRMPGLTAARAEECVRSGLRRMHVLVETVPSALVQRSLERIEEAKRRLGIGTPEVVLTAPEGPPLGAAPSQRYRYTGVQWSTSA